MNPVQVACPACGGSVPFKIGSSIVSVCPYCRSAVARGDRKVEDLGKVAALVATDSPLEVGLTGKYQGVRFQLTGRAQLGHQAGGLWDEWYAAFSDGRWGWLAEAQGRFYLTFEQELPDPDKVPPFNKLKLGQPAPITKGKPFMVAEKGKARALGAEGEIPYLLTPGRESIYADLSGPSGEFATLDYSESPPICYVGTEVTLDDLGIPKSARKHTQAAERTEGVQLSCPNCGGALALRAPDKTERVGCPNCASLLDVNQGQLSFLKALEPGVVKPVLELGSTGTIQGQELTVIGLLVRSVKFDKRYFWEEYLLYNPRIGFRWLVCSDDHWSFVEPVSPGKVTKRKSYALLDGNKFKIFQKAAARVEHVIGECYWKVEVGEKVRTADYIKPPCMLSREESLPPADVESDEDVPAPEPEAGEINWSLGTYVTPQEVEKAFGVSKLARPSGVAPNQPFRHKAIYKYWAILLAASFFLGLVFVTSSRHKQVFEQNFPLPGGAVPDKSQVFFTEPFDLNPRQNIEITATAQVDNGWVAVEGELVSEATGVVAPFDVAVSYYHGVDDGESWSEGSNRSSEYLSAVPKGSYQLRLEFQREKPQAPLTVGVRVRQDVPRLLYWFLTLLLISLLPGLVLIYHLYFESQRWKDSDYSPFRSE